MHVFISPTGNREIWAARPDGYFTEEEWKQIHPDKIYSVIGTNHYRLIVFPYDSVMDNEAEMKGFPPDDVSVSTPEGTWMECDELLEIRLAQLRQSRLDELNAIFGRASENAHCLSSAGIEINANETANRNIASLIIAMEASGQETVQFCAYDNHFHEVTLAQLKTMQLEIIAHAQALYALKWYLREKINAADTIEALKAIEMDFGEGEKNGAAPSL